MQGSYLAKAGQFKHGFLYEKSEGIGWYRAASLQVPGLRHGFSTREGGVTTGRKASLNLHWDKDGCEADVLENYRRFARGAGIAYDDMVIVNHAHGANVIQVDRLSRGRGFTQPPLPFCDGLITNDPAVAVVTSHADCGAFFLYDPENRAVGMAHAGWKGTLLKIGLVMAEAMGRAYGTRPENLIAVAGPCICPKCFEVDADLGEEFARAFDPAVMRPGRPGKAYVDLPLCAGLQFLQAGILPEHITLMDACTYEDPERFYSHRRDKGGTGSMAAYMQLQ